MNPMSASSDSIDVVCVGDVVVAPGTPEGGCEIGSGSDLDSDSGSASDRAAGSGAGSGGRGKLGSSSEELSGNDSVLLSVDG